MKKQFVKYMSLLLALTLLLSACAGNENPQLSETPLEGVTDEFGREIDINKSSVFKISYSKSDSLNPYSAQSLNNQLVTQLLYSPLFKLDASFAAVPVLADGFEQNGSTLVVTLKSSVKFANGSSITADDVVRSFANAKQSPAFSEALAGVSSANAVSGAVVEFKLGRSVRFGENLLTFPIAANEKNDAGLPYESGKFVIKSDGDTFTLSPNGYYSLPDSVATSVLMVNVENKLSIENALKIGSISFSYDELADGSAAGIRANSVKVPLNNLVFIGLNSDSLAFSDEKMRQSISFALNRTEIASKAYQGYATPASSVFNPHFKQTGNEKMFSLTTDSAAAKNAVEDAMYGGGKLRLLVNDGNLFRSAAAEMIAQQLLTAKINVEIIKLPYDEYIAALESGSYELYLGETRLAGNMSLQPFFESDGAARYGIASDNAAAEQYRSYAAGETQLGDFIISFNSSMPFVPLLYRSACASYTGMMKTKPKSYCTDVFANIHEWTF